MNKRHAAISFNMLREQCIQTNSTRNSNIRSKNRHWSYEENDTGPSYWADNFAPAGKGLHQSPIDIALSKTIYDPSVCPDSLNFHYVPANCKNIVNNGHTIQVNVDDKNSANYLTSWIGGGPLRHKFKLEQFHFHWGQGSNDGSEHSIDGVKYAAELHLVHWNKELYTSFSEAVKSSNGLAVVTVLIKEGLNNPFFQQIIDHLPSIQHADETTELKRGFDPSMLLPTNRSKYLSYSGSLTTPPLYESARFIIFFEVIQFSSNQLQALRNLNACKRMEKGHKISHNYRPVQQINDRIVVRSFSNFN